MVPFNRKYSCAGNICEFPKISVNLRKFPACENSLFNNELITIRLPPLFDIHALHYQKRWISMCMVIYQIARVCKSPAEWILTVDIHTVVSWLKSYIMANCLSAEFGKSPADWIPTVDIQNMVSCWVSMWFIAGFPAIINCLKAEPPYNHAWIPTLRISNLVYLVYCSPVGYLALDIQLIWSCLALLS